MPPVIEFGDFVVQLDSRELSRRGRRIHLQEKPFQALTLLLRRAGELVTREELQRELWPPSVVVDFDRGLNAAMARVRDALDDPARNSRFVQTLHGRGYRFVAPLRTTLPPTPRLERIAMHDWNRRDPMSVRRALRGFQRSIDEDPLNATGYAGAALCYGLLADYGWMGADDAFPRARASAQRALELDPSHPEAHTAHAFVLHRHDWRWMEAEAAYLRALDEDTGCATAHHWYAEFLSQQGRHDEAIRRIAHARRLDPLSAIISTVEAWILFHAGRYDDAAARAASSMELREAFAIGHFVLGRIRLAQGRIAEALGHCSKAANADANSAFIRSQLAVVLARAGCREDAEAILLRLSERWDRAEVSPFFLAKIHASLERPEHALDELERGLRERSSWMLDLKVDPELGPLRATPRFTDMLAAMGL